MGFADGRIARVGHRHTVDQKPIPVRTGRHRPHRACPHTVGVPLQPWQFPETCPLQVTALQADRPRFRCLQVKPGGAVGGHLRRRPWPLRGCLSRAGGTPVWAEVTPGPDAQIRVPASRSIACRGRGRALGPGHLAGGLVGDRKAPGRWIQSSSMVAEKPRTPDPLGWGPMRFMRGAGWERLRKFLKVTVMAWSGPPGHRVRARLTLMMGQTNGKDQSDLDPAPGASPPLGGRLLGRGSMGGGRGWICRDRWLQPPWMGMRRAGSRTINPG